MDEDVYLKLREFLDTLPRNPSGKVVKPQLRDLQKRTERV